MSDLHDKGKTGISAKHEQQAQELSPFCVVERGV